MKVLQYIRVILLAVLLVLSALSYHPMFFSTYGGDAEDAGRSSLSTYITVATVILLVICLKPVEIWKCGFLKKLLVGATFAIIELLLLLALFNNSGFANDLQSVLMAISLLIIGYCAKISPKQFILLSLLYIVASAFTSYWQVQTNIGGFIIADQYLANAKNSIGVLAAVACICSFYMSMTSTTKNYTKFFYLGVAMLLFVLLLTIRARASSLSILLVVCIYYFKKSMNRGREFFKVAIVLVLAVSALSLFGVLGDIGEFTFSSFTSNQQGDISSGRTERNVQAIEIILSDPLFGRMKNDVTIGWVHNYVLRVLSSYGMLGGCFLLYIYGLICYSIYKNVRLLNVRNLSGCGFYVMMPPLISSLFEPTFPYSPGTAIVFAFVAFGFSLRQVQNKSYNIRKEVITA